MTNLAKSLAAEIKRMNEKVIPYYVALSRAAPSAALTVAIMRDEVRQATEAAIAGNVDVMNEKLARRKDPTP